MRPHSPRSRYPPQPIFGHSPRIASPRGRGASLSHRHASPGGRAPISPRPTSLSDVGGFSSTISPSSSVRGQQRAPVPAKVPPRRCCPCLRPYEACCVTAAVVLTVLAVVVVAGGTAFDRRYYGRGCSQGVCSFVDAVAEYQAAGTPAGEERTAMERTSGTVSADTGTTAKPLAKHEGPTAPGVQFSRTVTDKVGVPTSLTLRAAVPQPPPAADFLEARLVAPRADGSEGESVLRLPLPSRRNTSVLLTCNTVAACGVRCAAEHTARAAVTGCQAAAGGGMQCTCTRPLEFLRALCFVIQHRAGGWVAGPMAGCDYPFVAAGGVASSAALAAAPVPVTLRTAGDPYMTLQRESRGHPGSLEDGADEVFGSGRWARVAFHVALAVGGLCCCAGLIAAAMAGASCVRHGVRNPRKPASSGPDRWIGGDGSELTSPSNRRSWGRGKTGNEPFTPISSV